MADLKVALEDVQDEPGSKKLSHARWRPHRTWAALLIFASGFFAWRELQPTPELGPLGAVALTTFPGEELYPSFSPDGNHVAFTWTGAKQDNSDIYVQQIGAGSPLRLTTEPLADYNPVWSPDGRWIAFLRGQSSYGVVGKSELRVIPPLGGPERKLAEIRVREVYISRGYLDWCPDGTCLIVTDSLGEEDPAALFVVSFETGEKRRLTDPRPPVLGDSNPRISPDGRLLVFRRSIAGRSGEIYWLRLGTGQTAAGEPVRLTSLAKLNAVYPAWMPNSEDVLFSAKGILWRQSIRGERPAVPVPFVGEDGIMSAVSRPPPGRQARLVMFAASPI
jgi:Tol biopolymer transport system component